MKRFCTMLFLFMALMPMVVNAYEVYEHNTGDESHFVSKSKVLGAKAADINGFHNNTFAIYNKKLIFDYTRKSSDRDNLILEAVVEQLFFDNAATLSLYGKGMAWEGNDLKVIKFSVKITYHNEGGYKYYDIDIVDGLGNPIHLEGRPMFFKKYEYGMCKDVIGSETSKGSTPVFIEWLENAAKKCKVEINHL